MKTFRRIIASTLALLMVLASLLTVNVFAETVKFPDVADDYAYKNAIYSLVEAGIINGIKDEATGVINFKPEDTVTRAQFAKLLAVKLAGNVEFAETTERFPDLPKDHWANGYIAYAVKAGIINGTPEGLFLPENPVTYGEAIKMLVCAMNYGSLYTATEPWYDGYIKIANQIELTKYAQSIGSNPAPRGRVAQLIYNMDYCKTLNVSGGGANGGINIREDKNEYKELTGVVEAVFEDNLTGENLGLNKLQVIISGEVYNIGDLNLNKFYPYLGKMVYIRYSEGNVKTVLSIEESGSNDTITIDARNISSVDNRVIKYYESDTSNKTTDARLSDGLYVIYNGKGVPREEITESFIEEYLDVSVGEITLMNNDGGREYDIAYVTSYKTYYVTGKGSSGDVYTYNDSNNINGASVAINKNDCEDNVFKVTSVGGNKDKTSLSNIASKNVISVAVPYNSTNGTEVVVSTITKTEEVDEMNGDESIVIGDKEYRYSDYFLALKDRNPDEFSLSVGDKATFYFDHAGNLVFLTKSESTDPYAYVLGYDPGQGLESVHSISLFTINGTKAKAEPFPVADNVKINGGSGNPEKLQNLLKENALVINAKYDGNGISEGEEYGQLVRYKTAQRSGVTFLTEIYTINKDNLANGNVVPGAFKATSSAEKEEFTDGTKLKYKNKNFLDADGKNQFAINNNTIIIQVPDDRTDSEKFKKRTGVFTDDASYLVEPYDIKSNIAKVVLFYNNSTTASITYKTNVAFVTDIKGKKNSESEVVQELTYYYAGETETKTALTEKDDTLAGIKAGDLIRFAVEGGEIVKVEKLFVDGVLYDPAGNVTNYFEKGDSKNPDYYQVIYGTVDAFDIDAGSISIVPGVVTNKDDYDNSSWMGFVVNSSSKSYQINEENGEFDEPGDLGLLQSAEITQDATIASHVVAIVFDGKVKAIYILPNA